LQKFGLLRHIPHSCEFSYGLIVTRYLFNAVTLILTGACFLWWSSPPAIAAFAAGVSVGNIDNSSVTEASGLAVSHKNTNVMWVHNDSGDSARVFSMTTTGTDLGKYSISGAGATDWEDMAIGPGPTAGAQYLYVGDIGDNFNSRSSISVYRVPEPTVSATQSPVSTSISGADRLQFAYPDGARDAESLFVDPQTRDIYIISKQLNPRNVYRAAYPQSTTDPTILQLVATISGATAFTAADISPGGNEIIVRSYATSSGSMYVRPPGGSIAAAFSTTPISIPLRSEGLGEAIAFDANGWGYYTTSEGSNEPIYYFDRLPHGDFNHNGVVDAADYVVWQKSGGTTYQGGDFDWWRSNFGKTAAGTGSDAIIVEVPEPSVAVLIVGSMLFGFGARRRVSR
jgi:hypothetical protein